MNDISTINTEQGCDLISELMNLKGALNYSGDCSYQVAFLLANGETLRFGVTDDDVGSGKLWVDQYSGLKIKGAEEGDLKKALNSIDRKIKPSTGKDDVDDSGIGGTL